MAISVRTETMPAVLSDLLIYEVNRDYSREKATLAAHSALDMGAVLAKNAAGKLVLFGTEGATETFAVRAARGKVVDATLAITAAIVPAGSVLGINADGNLVPYMTDLGSSNYASVVYGVLTVAAPINAATQTVKVLVGDAELIAADLAYSNGMSDANKAKAVQQLALKGITLAESASKFVANQACAVLLADAAANESDSTVSVLVRAAMVAGSKLVFADEETTDNKTKAKAQLTALGVVVEE